MEYPKCFRVTARDALRGNWRVAVLTSFVASLIGANIVTSGSGGNNGNSGIDVSDKTANGSEMIEQLYPFILVLFTALIVWVIIAVVIGGAGKLGYAKFNLNLIDRKQASFSDLFSQFNRLGTGFCMNFLMSLYTSLWSMLFIIPGIVKSYSYAMTPYILAEHTDMSANEAITESRRIMHGNKWNLFCLHFSFIGWNLLGTVPMLIMLTLGIAGVLNFYVCLILSLIIAIVWGSIIGAYREAAQAAFYREVSFMNLQYATSVADTEENENQ